MDTDDTTRALQVAVRAAREGGRVAASRLGEPGYLKWKGPRDVVAEALLEIQDAIESIIRAEFPDDGILTEEGPGDALLPLDAPRLWIVEPICGRLNFAYGIPFFAVSVALRSEGNIAAGVVYDPCRDELFEASRQSPAKLNGRKIVVQQLLEGQEAWNSAMVGTDWPSTGERREHTKQILAVIENQVRECNLMGSPALGLCYVAAGRLHAYWHLDLKIWDIAASSLILERAGGILTDAEGTTWLYSDGGYIASNDVIHGWALNCIQGVRNAQFDPRTADRGGSER